MRLIDADALLLYLADFQLQESPDWGANGCGNRDKYEAITDCIEAIKDAPEVDAVPVVRCRNCADYQTDWKPSCSGVYYCATLDSFMRPNDFCSYGERRDGKEDQQE